MDMIAHGVASVNVVGEMGLVPDELATMEPGTVIVACRAVTDADGIEDEVAWLRDEVTRLTGVIAAQWVR